ncbi:putative transcriptional regulator [Bacillus sp. TS-2]|nr:putative transcriptional regulator [Bacillus sp. TS-2]
MVNPISCKADTALDVLVGKWTHKILYQLIKNETMRFNELKRAITGITQKVLTAELRELEEQDIVIRKIYAQIPPKVEYSLTGYGATLIPILEAMDQWGKNHKKHLEELAADQERSGES